MIEISLKEKIHRKLINKIAPFEWDYIFNHLMEKLDKDTIKPIPCFICEGTGYIKNENNRLCHKCFGKGIKIKVKEGK